MAKVRVYELARELKIESKVLMSTLKSVGINVNSHQSTLSDDQVDIVRRAMGGDLSKKEAETEVKAAASPTVVKRKGGAEASAKSKRVVIRRRRGGEEKPEESATESSTETADAQAQTPAAETAAKPQDEQAQEATQRGTATDSDTSSVVAQTSEPQAAERQAEAVDSDANSQEQDPVNFANERIRKMKQSTGATIVRKASPEEVERRKAETSRSRSKQEDSRGTKYTGVGSGRGKPAHKTTSTPMEMAPDIVTKEEGRRNRTKRKETEEFAPDPVKRPVAKSSKRTEPNTRVLLREIDSLDDALDVSAPVVRTARTVYTPSASQKRRDLKRRKDLKKTEVTVARASYRVVKMGETITLSELARQLKVKVTELIKKLMAEGMMVTANQDIDKDTAEILANDYNYEIKSTTVSLKDILGGSAEKAESAGSETRAPIVTIMGHVDHGKTSILDAIREGNVAAGEQGGITQHIGAYSVMHNDNKIVFLDTPGHEAFSSMRARGAKTTDIAIVVVAADDGVMPQTIEAISHAKDAEVPIIVAINKMDKPNTNVERIYTEMAEHEVQAEEWGGDIQFVKVSAHTKMGLDELLDAINLQAEMLELKTDSKIPASGVVIEAHMDPGKGVVANVLVKHGTLRVGDDFVAGTEAGRVRAITDHLGQSIDVASPATPIEILGLSGIPMAGDLVNAVENDKKAREVIEWRKENTSKKSTRSSAQSLDDLLGKMQAEETPTLNIILKADTQGSVEAIVEAAEKLNSDRVKTKVVHKAVGGISESDLSLAEASDAIIVGFNVRAARGLDDEADKRGVVVRYFGVIYDLLDAVKNLMAGKLPPIVEEIVVGRAEVKDPISVPRVGVVAGSAVTDGHITRNSHLRLIRDEIVIYEGKIGSLRRFKDDVKEVKTGYECGISIENYNDIKVGDVIEAYEIRETEATF